MNASEMRKLAEEMAPIQAEKDRIAQEKYERRKAEEEARVAAEEQRKFEERYGFITGQIEWAAKKGRTTIDIDWKYEDDKVNILKRLHSDGFEARESKRFYEDSRCTADGGPGDPFTVEQRTYKIEW